MRLPFAALTTLCVLTLAAPAGAQVIRDGSIGPGTPGVPSPVPGGIDPTGEMVDYLIDESLGETFGGSLYHSFSTFSIGAGEIATFTGSDSIDLVLARVTGDPLTGETRAFVNGTLRSTAMNAELFLLAPGGIVIGQGARLDVPRSIHFGTPQVVRFGADPSLDLPTDSLARPAMLSTAPPSAFGFGPDPAPITVGVIDPTGAEALTVAPGQGLTLIGGDVTFTGGLDADYLIRAPGADVQIASTAGSQDVPVTQTPDGTRLDLAQLPADALDGDVRIQQDARIDIGGPNGSSDAAGSLIVRAGNFTIQNGRIEAFHHDDAGDAGQVDIGVRDAISIDGASVATSTSAMGDGADLSLTASRVTIGGSSVVRMISTGEGDSGDLSITADQISVVEQARVWSVNTDTGSGGDVRLTALAPGGDGLVTVAGDGVDPGNGSRLASSLESETRGGGLGGAIVIESDGVVVTGSGDVISTATATATQAGGAISIRTGDLLVEDGSRVATTTRGSAAGGALTVEGPGGGLADRVVVRNSAGEPEPARISTDTVGTLAGAGQGGALTIRTTRLELLDGGQAFARTEGSGDAGALDVDADHVLIRGVLANPADPFDPFRSGITSRVGVDGATGNGTRLEIDTRILEVFDGAQVSTATLGQGDAGVLDITATERMTVQGGASGASRVSAAAVAGPTAPGGGSGGLLTITAGRLELLDGGQVTASTTGAGNPGEVGDAGDVVVVADALEVRGAAGFDESGIFSKSNSAAATGVGDGGDITLTIHGDAAIGGGGLVEVSSSGDGNAGSIELSVDGDLQLSGGGRVGSSTTDFSGGRAGSVTVYAGGDVSLDGGSEISAATGVQSSGPGGVVTVGAEGDVRLSGASRISSSSGGFGDAGDITIAARRVLAREGSAIETRANAASGGSITVVVGELMELVGSRATTSVQGLVDTSDAGNIRIVTPGSLVVNRSAVVAQAVQGAGGQIDVVAGNTFVSGDSVISASSEQGPQGVVNLPPPENALLAELTSLPADLVDPTQLLASACDTRTEREGSFTVRARPEAGVPPDVQLDADLAHPSAPETGSCEEPR